MVAGRVVVLGAALGLTLGGLGQSGRPRGPRREPSEIHLPALINTCLITSHMSEMLAFYRQVLEMTPQLSGSDYAEFRTPLAVLALFSAEAQEKYIPQATAPASNRSAILEFEVLDVDVEYARLQKMVRIWVKPPTTQPWGTRSVYFRDPDGNLVDFFAQVKRS